MKIGNSIITNSMIRFRQSDSNKPIIVALNFGESWQTIDLTSKYDISQKMKVVVASVESQYVEG